MPLKNKSMLARVLGIPEAEAADSSLDGRLRTVARLKAAKRVEIARGKAQSWLYDVNRHINLCILLDQKEAALMADLAQESQSYNLSAI
jgi:hypothetical protein